MRLPLLCFLFVIPALAQAPRFPTVYYGAAYYHEYVPEERLEKDVELMKKAGVTVVRIGESTWSSWEPRDGHFESADIDRVVEAKHKAGIKVILGTPTYSIPPVAVLQTSGDPGHAPRRAQGGLRNPSEHGHHASGVPV